MIERIAALVAAGIIVNISKAAVVVSDSRNGYRMVAFVAYDGAASIERAIADAELYVADGTGDEDRALAAIVQGEV